MLGQIIDELTVTIQQPRSIREFTSALDRSLTTFTLPRLFSAFESVLPVREKAEIDGDEVLVNSYEFKHQPHLLYIWSMRFPDSHSSQFRAVYSP